MQSAVLPLPYLVLEYRCRKCGTWRWTALSAPRRTACAGCRAPQAAEIKGRSLLPIALLCAVPPVHAYGRNYGRQAKHGEIIKALRAKGWIPRAEAVRIVGGDGNTATRALGNARCKRVGLCSLYLLADCERLRAERLARNSRRA